jgi:hypothetical protein
MRRAGIRAPRFGHRNPDTTLRVYTREWKYHEAQKSRIGED